MSTPLGKAKKKASNLNPFQLPAPKESGSRKVKTSSDRKREETDIKSSRDRNPPPPASSTAPSYRGEKPSGKNDNGKPVKKISPDRVKYGSMPVSAADFQRALNEILASPPPTARSADNETPASARKLDNPPSGMPMPRIAPPPSDPPPPLPALSTPGPCSPRPATQSTTSTTLTTTTTALSMPPMRPMPPVPAERTQAELPSSHLGGLPQMLQQMLLPLLNIQPQAETLEEYNARTNGKPNPLDQQVLALLQRRDRATAVKLDQSSSSLAGNSSMSEPQERPSLPAKKYFHDLLGEYQGRLQQILVDDIMLKLIASFPDTLDLNSAQAGPGMEHAILHAPVSKLEMALVADIADKMKPLDSYFGRSERAKVMYQLMMHTGQIWADVLGAHYTGISRNLMQ